ncbi:MAG: hypothetical protein HIU91_09920 [Acidobacteria bacterium]|nr:hypothetical protein [Acidobacteriota bacterium]
MERKDVRRAKLKGPVWLQKVADHLLDLPILLEYVVRFKPRQLRRIAGDLNCFSFAVTSPVVH